jgi:5-formyltetrahydrofolate cyclo-ligase
MRGAFLQAFLRELNAAATAPSHTFPQPLPRKASPRTAINEDLREKLKELRNEHAAKLNMDSGMLAKQNQLNILADDLQGSFEEKFKAANFMNWQREIWKELVSQAVWQKTLPELRAWARGRLKVMSEEEKTSESEELVFELSKHSVLGSGYVAAFYATELEPQIFPLLNKLATENRLLLPRVLDGQNMDFVHVKNLEQDLQPGTFGVMEPKADLPAFEGSPAAFLVPGMVFGKDGSRIGHGKGYYDRVLALHKGIPKIGVAYKSQIRSTLPQNATDVKMNEVMWVR